MKQYNAIKAKYPDAILLFRVGDFYETFGEDAIKAARTLGIVQTKRGNGSATEIELAGFPYHSLENYLPKLVRAGYRVAICEQLEDPKMTKTIVKRDVTEMVSPGVSFSEHVLNPSANNWLCGFYPEGKEYGIAFLDVSTGEFSAGQGDKAFMEKLLQSFSPSEVVVPRAFQRQFSELFSGDYHVFTLEAWIFEHSFARDLLLAQFGTPNLKGFGLDEYETAVTAAGAILHYLKEARHDKLPHIHQISRIEQDKFVWLDAFTARNLELVHSTNENATTLFSVLNRTLTPPGARTLRRRLLMPLKDPVLINERLNVVDFLHQHPEFRNQVAEGLKPFGDPERITARLATGRVTPRELLQLKRAMECIQSVKKLCAASGNESLKALSDRLNPARTVVERIEQYLEPEAPAAINKGGVIKKGVNSELDELRNIAFSGKDYLVQMQIRESEKTGISSLKVGFNNVFGYYIEVTHTHKEKVPPEWIRKQTLTGAERYITPELKEYEDKILGAEEKILALETRLYNELVVSMAEFIPYIRLNASVAGELDCAYSFAEAAAELKYAKPLVNDSFALKIIKGRHPVIETRLPADQPYIPNDIYLDTEEQQEIIITGPNMSGKSALLRQTALIVLMAQAGSFVPAEEAVIGYCDKIFTRVGASDNMSAGESTFMVEMNETANILNNLSARSLILLDEIGRGTSTYDGISIAWAIAEYIHEHPKFRAKTLFATHYHELNELANRFKRIKNFHVSVKEVDNKVVFLRKLMPGGSEHSFGIHVAEMAGMPRGLVSRANEILSGLEKSNREGKTAKTTPANDNFQLSFFQLDDPVLQNIREEISRIDINTLTPVEALMKLNEIKKLSGLK
ncbi:MAG: DNA mismatch repair protein MutS [Flavobacteriales bacterium]|nr:DNA mismatch repair protein MutS [Flavobacteriales bacterium]